jgi:hypothetical protein
MAEVICAHYINATELKLKQYYFEVTKTMLCRLSQVPDLFIVCAAVMQESTQQCMYANQPILSGFFDRRNTLLMPIELLDLGFSVANLPFASLAAGLGLGLGV